MSALPSALTAHTSVESCSSRVRVRSLSLLMLEKRISEEGGLFHKPDHILRKEYGLLLMLEKRISEEGDYFTSQTIF